jgi:hypothetical protein
MRALRVAGWLIVFGSSGLAAAQAPPPNPPGARAEPPPPPGPASAGAAAANSAPAPVPAPSAPPAASRAAPLIVADAADVAAFETGLADAERQLAARKWAAAEAALDALLAAHVDHAEVLLHASEVREGLERAAFGQAYTEPDIKSLISGELQSYDPRSGKIKLRYKRDPKAAADEDEEELSQTERVLRELLGISNSVGKGDFTWAAGVPMHPIHFAGPYTVEISGFFPEMEEDTMIFLPYVVLSMGQGETYNLNLGYPLTVRDTTTWSATAYIAHSLGGKRAIVDEEPNSPIKAGKPYSFKIVVTDDKITASYNGKVFLSTTRTAGTYGQFGFRSIPEVKTLDISGQANTAWLEGLLDSDQHEAWTEFEEENKEKGVLPDWLAARFADKPRTFAESLGDFPGVANSYHSGHLVKLRDLEKKGEYAQAVEYLRGLAAAKCTEEFRQVLLALFCEAADDEEGALAACEKALELAPDFVPARVQHARLLHSAHRETDARAELQKLLDAGSLDGALHAELVRETLFDEGPAAARVVLASSLRAGVPAGYLANFDAVLLRAQRGPSWDKPFEFKSRNYLVRSDHSQKLCADASQALEQALGLYNRTFGRPAAEGEAQRYPVYLFSGLSGYLAYAGVLFGSAPTNTAGLYSPVLKQLLIWNLPDRDDMLRTVRHEGFHQYLDRLLDDAPTWFNEGTAEYFEVAEVDGGQLEAGPPSRGHVLTLTHKDFKWTPVDELVRMGQAEFYKEAGSRYAQAWALVHCLLEGSREDKALYTTYMQGLLAGEAPRALADRVFPASGAPALLDKLKAHVKALRKELDAEVEEK